MDLVKLYSTFSIILLGLLSTSNIHNISAQPNVEHYVQLIDFFRNEIDSFNTVHVLAQINIPNRKFICSQFTRNDIDDELNEMVDLVFLDQRRFNETYNRFLQIPIFMCKLKVRSYFFVTYTRNNQFYQLSRSSQGPYPNSDPTDDHIRIMVEVTNSKTILPGLLKIVTSVEKSVIQYFKSEYYIPEAVRIFDLFSSEILHICKMFSSEYHGPRRNYEYERTVDSIKIHKKIIQSVPCVICYPAGRRDKTSSFNVFFYHNNIFFKITNKYEMKSYLRRNTEIINPAILDRIRASSSGRQ